MFVASSGVRLHDKPAEPASTWTFPWEIDGEEVQVLIRDRIDSSRGYPQHLGLEVRRAFYEAVGCRAGSAVRLGRAHAMELLGR